MPNHVAADSTPRSAAAPHYRYIYGGHNED